MIKLRFGERYARNTSFTHVVGAPNGGAALSMRRASAYTANWSWRALGPGETVSLQVTDVSPACGYRPCMMSRTIRAVSLGVRPTRTPTFSRASFFAWAVPAEPEMIAPACPMVLPSGAVNPAT